MKRTLLQWGPVALLILISLLIYRGAPNHTRLAPEEDLIWGNPAVADGKIGDLVLGRWQAGEYRPQVRPAAALWRAAEHGLFQFRRGSFQTDQILLHGVAAVLVFLLLASWLRSRIAGILGGLLFLTHPGASHTVLYLGGLSEILSGVFFLWALLLLTKQAGATDRGREAPAVAASCGGMLGLGVLAFLAMSCKEIGFLLPFVAAGVLLALPLPRARRVRLYIPIAAAACVAILYRIVALLAAPEPMRRIPAVDPTSGMPALSTLGRALAGMAAEVGVLGFPWKLTHEYSWLYGVHGAGLFAMAAVSVVLVLSGAWLIHRRRAGAPAIVPLVLLALLPLAAPVLVAGPSGTLASERNLYLALPGWIGLLLLAGRSVIARRPGSGPALAGLAVGVALLFGARTMMRVPDFSGEDALREAGLRSHPKNPELLFEQGNLKLARQDFDGAKTDYEQALRVRPDFPLAAVNLGAVYVGIKDNGMALRILDPVAVRSKHVRALRIVDAKAHYHAGLILMQQDRDREAAEAFERTLLFYPDHLGARGNLGLIYTKAPAYVDRGIENLQYAIAREQDEKRRSLLEKAMNKARANLEQYIAKYGEAPSKREAPGSGAIGEPWKTAAAEGL